MDNALASILRSTEQPVLMDASGGRSWLNDRAREEMEKPGDDRWSLADPKDGRFADLEAPPLELAPLI